MIEQKQRLTTKALILRENKVLLVCEPNGKWELPGGKPDFAEHMEDTIRRELKEELGIPEVSIQGVAGQFDFISHCPEINTDYQFVAIVFRVDIGEADIALSHEHEKYAWLELEEINSLNIKPEYKAFLASILS